MSSVFPTPQWPHGAWYGLLGQFARASCFYFRSDCSREKPSALLNAYLLTAIILFLLSCYSLCCCSHSLSLPWQVWSHVHHTCLPRYSIDSPAVGSDVLDCRVGRSFSRPAISPQCLAVGFAVFGLFLFVGGEGHCRRQEVGLLSLQQPQFTNLEKDDF